LKETREQQAATAEILKVIASSPSDVQPVFDAIVRSAAKLFEPCSATITTLKDDKLYWGATAASISGFDVERVRSVYPIPFDPDRAPSARAMLERRIVEIPDVATPETTEFTRKAAAAGGFRSITFAPLVDREQGIGTIIFTHPQAGFRYSERQLALIQTFADQAVIAIQNARLFNETQEALERQTATADILKVIASSPSNVQPVFDAIATSAKSLIGAFSAVVFRFVDSVAHVAAFTSTNPAADQLLKASFPRPVVEFPPFERAHGGGVVQVPDTETEPDERMKQLARARGFRSVLNAPLMSKETPLGLITVTRKDPGSFADHHVQLLQSFADQAVIAIENTRLFNEVQARTRDLAESLEQQTAISEILRVISSTPGDVQPVLATVAQHAAQICEAQIVDILTVKDDKLHYAAEFGEFGRIVFGETAPINRHTVMGRSVCDMQPVQVADLQSMDHEFPLGREYALALGHRTTLAVPLIREGRALGTILVRRAEVRPFDDRHIALLKTFADQAAIAIENARLFNEVQAKTRDLSESLEQQTATSEVLEVISSSPGELDPVFRKMLENATRVCGANFGMMQLWNGEAFCTAAAFNVPPAFAALREGKSIRAHPQSGLSNVLKSHQVVHIHDVTKGVAYLGGDPNVVQLADIGGARTVVLVPMLKEDEFIGTFTIYRQEVRPFTDKQIALVENFTKQAVIAIENTRLLKELRQRTDDLSESLEQQTATSEVLQVISSSQGELEPVFQTMLESATRVCGANFGTMNLWDGEKYNLVAHHNIPPEFSAYRQRTPIVPHPGTALEIIVQTHRVVQVEDVRNSPAYKAGVPNIVGMADIANARTMLTVPMLKDDELLGSITIIRQEVRKFTDKQVALVENFTRQVVIAIENTRLLNELRDRTGELTRSLDELRTAQDRLVQTEKLASLGQLTAGIAHEIKNPLNFVNNFSALSAELTDELNDVLKPVAMDSKVRGEVDELTGLLKDNLEKVVQHGKRADSIVKNMLLHSREGSREHRPADINSLLDESLNLAYHGARAEKGEFNITLQRDFDADAGTIELFPQEITRAFLNLIANGVYATTRRKTENKEPGFKPTLRATTKNLGSAVEIRIRDNGTGIPAEVQEKMFNPFFTTKPAGEGTGLGLSMTHDIIVKQHGGRIDVATEPGQFTEFTIVLPRNLSGDRGET
jgi:two-component system, NtrC family, sensor kinase